MRMGTLLNNGCAALFHLFLGHREEAAPRGVFGLMKTAAALSRNSPKIGQRMTAQRDKAAGQDLASGPSVAAPCPLTLCKPRPLSGAHFTTQ